MDCRQCLPAVRAHPRSRGENQQAAIEEQKAKGSSPLTRGKRPHLVNVGARVRLIPAHAGKTSGTGQTSRVAAAHPRSRGENSLIPTVTGVTLGSSPLTRGKPWTGARARARCGLIPAHAGKTVGSPSARPPGAAHPRSRGENSWIVETVAALAGSSPLTRGKPRGAGLGRLRPGLIPAHAGKTLSCASSLMTHAAHPRSRGENSTADSVAYMPCGSSPLTRGKRGGGTR